MSDMIERLWRHDALRVQLQSRIGVVVASAVLLIAGQSATAQDFIDFEDPPYIGSAAGTVITGQDDFYIPVPDSHDGLVYTYLDNALGLPDNPRGGLQFAGVTGGEADPVAFARAQRDVTYGDGTGAWTVSFDIAATFVGDLPSAQNIGSFSTQLFDTESTFIALAMWTDPDTAATWDADYVWYNASGTQLTESVDDPGFQNLDTEHWYRWSTTFNLDTNQIVEVSIEDLTTNVTVTHSPIGRFLVGGSAGGSPPPSGFRLFGGAVAVPGNTLAFDNVDIDVASQDPPSGACCFEDKTCAYVTEAECTGAGGTYVGDFTACTDQGCIEIPKACGAKGTGSCGEANPGVPGCEDEQCCALVCFIFDPGCCSFEWDEFCAAAAVKLGCAILPCPVSTCDVGGGTCLLSQSQNPFINGGGSVHCQAGGNSTPNGWARCYNLVAEGVPKGENLTIKSVTFGVQTASIDGINIDVVIHLDCNDCPPVQPGVDALELARVSITVGTADVGSLITVDMPAGTVVPAGTDVIVEVFSVDDGTTDPTFAFLPMSNDLGQCGPSYIRTDGSCGLLGWSDLGDIGFPDAHLVQSVAANIGGNPSVECVPPPEACNKKAGACNEEHAGPGCNIEACCVAVCEIAPDCCKFDWDFFCVELADGFGACAVLELPEGFYIDEAEFQAALQAAGKVEKGSEDFSENILGDGMIDAIDDPLDTNSSDPETFPDGILIDNLTFQANTGGVDSSVPAPAGVDGLALATPAAAGVTSDTVVANTFVDAYDILSGPPAGDNHTAMSMTLVTIAPINGLVRVDVYDKQENLLGSATNVPAPVDGGQFLGLIFAEGVTIGRVNIFDPDSGPGAGAEGVYDVTVYVLDKQVPCPWDLDGNGIVGGTDLLSLLVNWGPYEPCPPFKPADFDQNCSVGGTDLLALLVNWGPCP